MESVQDNKKKCPRCGQEKKLKDFSKKGKNAKGHIKHGPCKDCDNDRKKRDVEKKPSEYNDCEIYSACASYYDWDSEVKDTSQEAFLIKSVQTLQPESSDFKIWEKYKGAPLCALEMVSIETTFRELILIGLDFITIQKGSITINELGEVK